MDTVIVKQLQQRVIHLEKALEECQTNAKNDNARKVPGRLCSLNYYFKIWVTNQRSIRYFSVIN